MRSFIESLEGRRLLSGTTSATLANDDTTISSDSTALKTSLSNLVSIEGDDDLAIERAVLALGLKKNIPLGAKAVAAAKAENKTLTADVAVLTKLANAAAGKGLAAGDALLLSPTSKPDAAKVKAAIKLLDASTPKTLGKLEAALAGTKLKADLNAIAAANPSADTVQTTITTAETDGTTNAALVAAAGTQVQTDVQTMAADLAAIAS
jgi:hypothetical protein